MVFDVPEVVDLGVKWWLSLGHAGVMWYRCDHGITYAIFLDQNKIVIRSTMILEILRSEESHHSSSKVYKTDRKFCCT